MNMLQVSRSKPLEDPENLGGKILRRRNLILKTIQQVQICMIEPLQQIVIRERIQITKIANHASSRIDLPAQGYLNGVVMPMPVGMITLAKHLAIALRVIRVRM